MGKKLFFILMVMVFLNIGNVFAETSIKAELDKASITTSDTLTYKIIIISSEKNLPQPEVPKFNGFNLISQAESSTVSLVKSEVKTILVYAFILAPVSSGKFKIDPAVIKINNKVMSSQAFEIEVTPGLDGPGKEELPPQLSDKSQITL